MLYRNGKFTGGSINKLDVFTTDVILKHKKTRFVIFHEVDENSNSSAPILLSENNQLYQAAGSGEYNVRGDYFEKLAALSFSYALVFLLVSFQDVINVTANVDQAQQNIVMTKVLNQFHQIT